MQGPLVAASQNEERRELKTRLMIMKKHCDTHFTWSGFSVEYFTGAYPYLRSHSYIDPMTIILIVDNLTLALRCCRCEDVL
jgi:hypothetical protein